MFIPGHGHYNGRCCLTFLVQTLVFLAFSYGARAASNDNGCMQAQDLQADNLATIGANVSVAIATTVLHPDRLLPVWLDYHLRWVQQVLIYMDDPDERPIFNVLCGDRPVTLLEGSQAEPQMTPESRLIRRQVANMKHAVTHLTDLGLTWLLHIDVDELLHGPSADPRFWATDPEIGLVTFANHEALPVDFETSNPFRDCVFFWVNGIDRNENFMAYGNGKSAVRLGPGVEPRGPHWFSGHAGRALALPGEDAMILHYPYPSYGSWLRKLKLYGRFSDYWFGDKRSGRIIGFMLESRDVVAEADRTGDWHKAQAFFNTRILDDHVRERALAQGKMRSYEPFADWHDSKDV